MNQIYYNELKKHKPLSEEQILEIYKRYNDGEVNALNRMIEANLRLVVLIAKGYHQTIKAENIIELEDLISEGNIGLIQACNKFKPELGVKFSSYAVYWIRRFIQGFILNNENNIKIPQSVYYSNTKINDVVQDLFQKNEFEITEKQIDELEIFTKFQIKNYFNTRNLKYENKNIDVVDFDSAFDFDEPNTELKNKIKEALKHLTSKERMYIKLAFGIDEEFPIPQSEIWETLKVSRQRTYQLRNSAYKKLNELLKNKIN